MLTYYDSSVVGLVKQAQWQKCHLWIVQELLPTLNRWWLHHLPGSWKNWCVLPPPAHRARQAQLWCQNVTTMQPSPCDHYFNELSQCGELHDSSGQCISQVKCSSKSFSLQVHIFYLWVFLCPLLKYGERSHNYFMNRTGCCWSHSVVCRSSTGLKVIQGNNGTQISADIKELSQILLLNLNLFK